MPFTPTHVVAVLPLRRVLPLTALAIGAMVPDVPHFFPVASYAQTHAPLGALTLCLPLGAACFLLLEWVLRRPLIALLPGWLAQRLDPAPGIEPGVGFWARVAVAIVLGAYTHQLWDAFSHAGGWGTHLVPMLNESIALGPWPLPGYKLVQYGSTVVGLPLLALWTLAVLARTPPRAVRGATLPAALRIVAYATLCLIPLGVGVYATVASLPLTAAVGLTIKRSGAMIAVGLVVYSLWYQTAWYQTAWHQTAWYQAATRGKGLQ